MAEVPLKGSLRSGVHLAIQDNSTYFGVHEILVIFLSVIVSLHIF